MFLINSRNNLLDYSGACSYRRCLIGSFNLTGEGVKYAQRSFEYDYLNWPAHMRVCHVQMCLKLDDVTVFSCYDVTLFVRPLMLPFSQIQKTSLLQFIFKPNNNGFIVSFILRNLALNRGHQGFRAARGHGCFGGLFQHSNAIFSAQRNAHWHKKTHPPTGALLAS